MSKFFAAAYCMMNYDITDASVIKIHRSEIMHTLPGEFHVKLNRINAEKPERRIVCRFSNNLQPHQMNYHS